MQYVPAPAKAPAIAPAKAPVMGLHYEPADYFQCRTHQNIYFSGRENPVLSGFSCCSPDFTTYLGIWNGFVGNIDFWGKPTKIIFSLITQEICHAYTSYFGQIMSTI